MFRKLLNLVVAASVAITSFAAPASAQSFMFRYKTVFVEEKPPVVEYGVGNDIVAYYVAPIGYDFEKKIPVATRDVVDWQMDSGEIPGGIGIDPTKGILSGQPAAEEKVEALFHGYDRSGNRIARAEIHFTTFEPVGEPVLVDFYAHVGTYFYGEIPNPQETTVARWEPIVPFATGLSMMGQALQGTPEAAGTWGVAWRGYDYLDREVAFAYGDLLVETGPVVEELLAGEYSTDFVDQVRDKNIGETFSMQAAVRRSLGQVTYKLVPTSSRPSGLAFSSANGTLSGVFDDFETKAEFRIEARDSYDGTTGVSEPFTLETLPQEISLANVYNLYGYAGTPYYRKFTTPNLVPTAQWTVISGTLPDGLTLNPTTGAISGTPAKKETQSGIVIGVSGAGMIAAQSSPFNFTVYPEYVSRETTQLHVRKDTPFTTDGVTVKGALSAYTISSAYPLQGDLAVNSTTGAVSSAAGISDVGSHDLLLIVDNGNRFGVYQSIRVYNPLEISYENIEVKRNDWMSVFPTINPNSMIGSESYSIVDVDGDPLPSWMTFQQSTGRIYGRPADKSTIDVTYGPFIVTRTDAQDSKPSDPFTIKVVDRDAVDLMITNNGVERFIHNGYRIATAKNAVGSTDHRVLSLPSNWPSTLRISGGVLVGRSEDPVGTVYSSVILEAEDSEGYKDTQGPFDIVVVEPKGLSALSGSLNRTVEWTAGMPYTGKLPALSNGYGTLGYALTSSVTGLSVTDATTGTYSFTVPTEGDYSATFTIDDETDRAPAQGALTLKINPELTLTAAGTLAANRAAYLSSATPTVSGGTKPLTYVQTGPLPKGVYFSNGTFYGTPQVEGQFPVSVTVTDRSGMSKTSSFTLDVGKPLPIDLKYPADALTVGQFKVVWPQIKNTIGALTYELTAPVDANGNDILPPGLSFDRYGRFIGTPSDAGVFGPYSVKVTDSDTVPRDGTSGDFSIVITRTGEVEFADVDVTVRKNASISLTLSASNIVPPVGYTVSSPAPLPNGLVLNGTTGALSGTLSDEGTVTFAVTAKDRMDREKTANVTFNVVGDMTTSATDVSLKQYEASSLASSVVTTNTLGTLNFTLSAGTLPAGLSVDPVSGAIIGTSDEAGSWPVSVDVTDTDGQKQTASFTVTVDPREPLVVDAPVALSLKRFAAASFTATVTDAIPPVQYSVTPDLPTGIALDTATGAITGSSDDVVASTVYTLTATDAKGGQLGTDTTQFTLLVEERDALTVTLANVSAKRYEDITAVAATPVSAIGAVTYSVAPSLPAGITLDQATGTISGKSDDVIPSTTYTLTATDEKGGALGTATTTFTVEVADRDALEFVTTSDQAVLLDEPYSLTLAVKNIVGTNVTFTEVAGSLPEGLVFDASTGTISGTAVNYDEKTSFTVKAEDDFGGVATLVIAFSVGITPGDLTITAHGGTTRVGEAFTIQTPTAADTVGTVTWSLSAPGTGLTINASTGEISGTPLAAVETDAAISVKDVTGRRGSTTVRVIALPRIELAVTDPMGGTFNYEIDAAKQAVATEVVGTAIWSLAGPSLPNGMGFDTTTGAVTGKPLEIGTFGPYTITVADDLPGVTAKSFSIKVEMNGDPIELAVTDFETKIGYPVQTATPSYANNLGPVTFFSTDLGSTGLAINPATGVLTGTAQALADQFINVSVRDRDTLRVTSRPLRYKVIPKMQITLPSQVIISALTDINPVAPTRNNVIGTATWEPLDQSVNKLPDGIVWDETTGTLRGNAKEIGTFGPFTVASTDSLGDRGVSNSFVVKSNPGAFFLGLAAATLPDAVKRTETYTYDFTPHLTTVGMDLSEVTWSGSALPPGLTITNGVLSGTPALSGTFNFNVTVSYDNISATRGYTLVVNLPQTKLELADADLGEAKREIAGQDKSFTADLKGYTTVENIPLASVKYTLEPFQPINQTDNESFPVGLTLNPDGTITGTATSADGIYQFRVKANFTDATDENYSSIKTYTITVKDEIKFEFGTGGFSTAYKRLAYSFDLATLLDPAKTEGVTPAQLTWSWAIDPVNAVAPNMTALPAGLSISGSTVSGTPTNSGTYAVVVTASYAGRSKTKAFTLQSNLQTTSLTLTGTLPKATVGTVYNADVKSGATALNFPIASASWTLSDVVALSGDEKAGLPPGMSFDDATGKISGTTSSSGTYKFEIIGKWEDKALAAESVEGRAVFTLVVEGVDYKFTQIAASNQTTCGLTPDGGVMCWGSSTRGALGNGSGTGDPISTLPVQVLGLTSGVRSIAAGGSHACAITSSGGLKCWGGNEAGQIGTGSVTTYETTPVDVVGLTSGVSSVSVGDAHTCAVTTSGEAKCWGNGLNGRLGIGAATNSSVPVTVSGLDSGVASISAGSTHTCAVTTSGGAKCWGAGGSGQLGTGNTSSNTSPVDVSGLTSGVLQIGAGNVHTCALTTGGAVKCWGNGINGRLGNGLSSVFSSPQNVPALTSGVTSITVATAHSCVTTSSGGAKCWGAGTGGRIGNNTSSGVIMPSDVTGLQSGVKQVSAGSSHGCAVKTTNEAVCWGTNSNGVLGDGTRTASTVPVKVGG